MTAAEKASMAAKVARVAAYTAWDHARRPAAVELADIPWSAQAITPAWLTQVLCAEVPGAAVVSHEVTGGSDGSTSRRTLRVTYNEAGQEAGLPEAIFTKISKGFTTRILTGLAGALAAEAGFYTALRPTLDIEAPRALHARVDDATFRSVFVLDDVGASRGARFGNPTTFRVDRAMAESMVANMAAYHGACWASPALPDVSWLPTSLQFQLNANAVTDFRKRTLIGIRRAEGFAPDEFLRRREEIWPASLRALELNSRPPWTFLHSDVHIGNWYVAEDGRMGLYDWQLVSRGQWALDVAYALMSALEVEDRRAWEGDLLRLYLERLAAAGGDPPPFDRAWTMYRQQTFHGLIFWLFTLGAGPLQPQMQPQAVSEANVARMAQAVVDLESLDSLDA